MSKRDRLSGNEAVSVAIRQINPDVFAAFPITPSTEIPQYISLFMANGQMNCEYVPVESEHSSISCCLGAEASGVRAMTATSSCGLALMHEILYVVASDRQPVVMAVSNRSLSGPININNDHSDAMGERETGWLQLYAESAQEAYDNMLMAHRIAEHPDVRLPIMICQDGFITSHAVENIILEDDETVKAFVGEYAPEKYLLNPAESLSIGTYDSPAFYMEHKLLQNRAMAAAKQVVKDVSEAFGKLTGRHYGLIEPFMMADAELALVLIGSSAGTAKAAVKAMRAEGKKVGLIKVRSFRPFPAEEIAEALKGVKAVGIMDKTDSFNAFGGPLGQEVRAALYGRADGLKTMNYIYGLGGRDVSVKTIRDIVADLEAQQEPVVGAGYKYFGVRE